VTRDWKKERFPVLQQLILLLIDALIVDGIKKRRQECNAHANKTSVCCLSKECRRSSQGVSNKGRRQEAAAGVVLRRPLQEGMSLVAACRRKVRENQVVRGESWRLPNDDDVLGNGVYWSNRDKEKRR
jgi:hypothetical protein